MSSEKTRTAGGRPPKFREERRPVTVTLPTRVLRNLEAINPDRALAIVKCVEAVAGGGDHPPKAVELVEVLPGKALIVVGPSWTLPKINWLRLVEISPARYLLVLPSGMPVESLEVEILDLVDRLDPDDEERVLLQELCALIGHQRRQKTVSKAELVFIEVGKSKPGKRRHGPSPSEG